MEEAAPPHLPSFDPPELKPCVEKLETLET